MSENARKVRNTFARRALVRGRIRIMYNLSGWQCPFDLLWPMVRGRKGGFAEEELDRRLTTSGLLTNTFSIQDNAAFYERLRVVTEDVVRRRARTHNIVPDLEEIQWTPRRPRPPATPERQAPQPLAVPDAPQRHRSLPVPRGYIAPIPFTLGSICPICEEQADQLYPVSFFCKDVHKYCSTCIQALLRSSGFAIARCPGCTSMPIEQPSPLVVESKMHGLLDPHFVSVVPYCAPLLVNGNQLQPFLYTSVSTCYLTTHCPKCQTFIVGSPSSRFSNAARCFRNECGHLFCRRCYRDWHEGPCEQDAVIDMDERMIAEGAKKCPSCSAAIMHNFDHGCHRLTCMHCAHAFCFCCLKSVDKDPDGDESLDIGTCRCPIFCTETCGCPPCPDCKPEKPCYNCSGCVVCCPR